jgi:hypothetical protein
MTTVRTPLATVFETRAMLEASWSPGQCSASLPQVPICCSITPEALITKVYGESDITEAFKPIPNQTSAGPEAVIVASPPDKSFSAMSPTIEPDQASTLPQEVTALH